MLLTELFALIACLSFHAAASLRVCIVGGGISGLATGARLQRAGAAVTILEKNPDIGGRVSTETLAGGFRFDYGPTLMLLPEIYEETFRDLGHDLHTAIDVLPVEPQYNVYFEDGTSVTLTRDQEAMRAQLEGLQPGSYAAYAEYMSYAQLMLDVGLPNFIAERPSLRRLAEFAWQTVVNSPLGGHLAQLRKRFPSAPKLHALLSFQDLYIGLPPARAPAVFSLLQAIELNEGIYYPRGGFGRVVDALSAVATGLGVVLRHDTAVSEILVGEDGRAAGVRLASGETVTADCVVANADLPYVEASLLPATLRRPGLDKLEYSSSAVAFYWGCNRRWSQLAHHTVFLSTDERSWDGLFQPYGCGGGGSGSGGGGDGCSSDGGGGGGGSKGGGKASQLPHDFNFYVAAPVRTDPSACPPCSDVLTVLVPCPTLGDGAGTDDTSASSALHDDAEVAAAWVEQARRGVFRRFEEIAGMRGFADSIVTETVRSPLEWRRRYNLQRGAIFGLAHGLDQLSLLRPRQRHPRVPGLWFCGASTKPGNGVPLVLTGARQVAEDIAREYGLPDNGALGVGEPLAR